MGQITTWDEFPTVEYVRGVYRQTVSGEKTANSPIPAIVNAIYHACGVRVDSLPVTPEAILRGLEAKVEAAGREGAA